MRRSPSDTDAELADTCRDRAGRAAPTILWPAAMASESSTITEARRATRGAGKVAVEAKRKSLVAEKEAETCSLTALAAARVAELVVAALVRETASARKLVGTAAAEARAAVEVARQEEAAREAERARVVEAVRNGDAREATRAACRLVRERNAREGAVPLQRRLESMAGRAIALAKDALQGAEAQVAARAEVVDVPGGRRGGSATPGTAPRVATSASSPSPHAANPQDVILTPAPPDTVQVHSNDDGPESPARYRPLPKEPLPELSCAPPRRLLLKRRTRRRQRR